MFLAGFLPVLDFSKSFSLLSVSEAYAFLVLRALLCSPSFLEAAEIASLAFLSLTFVAYLLDVGSETFLAYFIFSILSIYS